MKYYGLFNLPGYTHLLINKKPPKQNVGGLAVFNLYASGWKIHDFASPPRGGFAFSMPDNYRLLVKKKASGL